MSRVKRIFPELPDVTPVAGTKILVADADDFAFGYADVKQADICDNSSIWLRISFAPKAQLRPILSGFACITEV